MSASACVHDLRTQLAAALCAAQAQPVPRSSFSKMLHRLLQHAFASLDEDSGVERSVAVRVAAHALAAWQAALHVVERPLQSQAVGG